ncbi:MAG: HlyD family secretion protein [Sphingomonadales bacterium]|nr:HlyD family secretion protein [Sphingomonadales bacterium]MBD3773297.1 HlyD family secretion protein [Paracoccaceae bacterium]
MTSSTRPDDAPADDALLDERQDGSDADDPQDEDDEADDTGKTRPWLKPLLLAVAGVALLYGGYSYYHYRTVGQYIQSTEDAYVSADEVAIASKLAGYVTQVAVADNAAVQQGALLVQIDPVDYRNRIDEADAQIEAARANAAATLSNVGEAQAAIAQAQAGVNAARADIAYFDKEIARYRPLVASGAEPKTALDQLISNRAKAAADLAAKQAAVVAARERVRSIRAQSGASEAQIRTAQVQRSAAMTDLGRTRLTAPIAGRVASSTVRTGQFVQPGMRLMTIVPTGDLFVEANFKETQIGLMRPGQPVTIKVDALPDVEFRGTVESITPGTGANFSLIPPQNATGNFTKIVQRVPVRIRIQAGPESRKVLVPGLSLEVEVDTRGAKGAIDAIRQEQDGGK